MSQTLGSSFPTADTVAIDDAPTSVVRRDGSTTEFDATKITVALTKAFLEVEGSEAAASSRLRAVIDEMTTEIVAALVRPSTRNRVLHVEDIQDQVELALMRGGHHKVARAYVLYREAHAQARSAATTAAATEAPARSLTWVAADGTNQPLDQAALAARIHAACNGLDDATPDPVLAETLSNIYDGIRHDELALAPILAARALVEREPAYSTVAARLLAGALRNEAIGFINGEIVDIDDAEAAQRYPAYFASYVAKGVEFGMLDPRLAEYDLNRIGAALRPERDLEFTLLGLQTLYDRYLLHRRGTRYELPQAFFMRVAMGLAVEEIDREERAIEFYQLLSSFDFMCSTPTLFNSGTTRPQLSSCFLTTVDDDLDQIFSSFRNNALLAKFSGGLGNDWTPVRGVGAHIKGTNGNSSGVVPFLKIANDTAVAVNQGGKRKGAVCAYLETWHIDVEEFLDLRKNTGDERRRTHDMNTANWVPDLFMQRVEADAEWTLFSPDETPDLHDLYGTAFAARYEEYEAAADRGELTVFRRVRAVDLWRRMLTMLFETGHPWITFKDPCNLRSPQQHAGVVHSSNLCTEITLNTSRDEVAVCNLGSVNLANHVTADGIDHDRLARTVTTAVRMLDNVIDINMYTIPEARRSNLRHRPVGLGMMGFQDALFTLRIPYASDSAVDFADVTMEAISFHALTASSNLAKERGRYPSFEGSLWSQGILPIDSVEILDEARNGDLAVDRTTRLDWDTLRTHITTHGMRNSNVLAIAPTATISNICGVGQSIEPVYRNLFVKSNMSGDFTVINPHLVRDLKALDLWDEVMAGDLKYFDGVLAPIARIPDDVKDLYATAFEVEPGWLVAAASRRQKWIDQAQSLNLYMAEPNGRKLDELYRSAWRHGLKTTYYLRSQSTTHVEKSTLSTVDGRLNAVNPVSPASSPTPAPAPLDSPPAATGPAASAPAVESVPPATPAALAPTPAPVPAAVAVADRPEPVEEFELTGQACSIDDPECEACQ